MELKPHDLLRLHDIDNLISYTSIPQWAKESLKKAPFVVVRRSRIMKDMVPIGIRGSERNERFAAFISYDNIAERITPNQLILDWNRIKASIRKDVPALEVLPKIKQILEDFHVKWGPGGSVGFELVSGFSTVSLSSDLDVIMYLNSITVEKANKIMKDISELSIRVDVQIETPNGAISLQEYANGLSPILIRTENGPYLVKRADIWKEDCNV